MRRHKWLRNLLTIILVALLIAIAVAIVLVGTGRAAKMLEQRGITFLKSRDEAPALSNTEETAPAEGIAPADGTVPAEGTTPADGTVPAEAITPADGTVPADGTAPVDGTAPAELTAPKDATAPADGTVPADPAAAATETVPTDTAEAATEVAPAEIVKLMIGDKEVHEGVTFTPAATQVTPAAGELTSKSSILINLTDDSIVLAENAEERISPASMTKIMALLVAAENLDPDAPITITEEMISYCASNGLSAAGFEVGKIYPARDLMYGAILPSGGEAVAGLAITTAGSLDAFVEMMNQRAADLGLTATHFTNCAGLYDADHYTTVKDVAAILKAALTLNDLSRTVLSTKVYTIPATEEGKEDLVLSNWFLRRIEDQDAGGEVIAAKTGFVTESGYCAASYAVSPTGVPYICVTANSDSEWNCIYDHTKLYKNYAA